MRRALALGFVTLALVASCKTKAGDSCKPSKVACESKKVGLVCKGETFMPVACDNDSCRAVNGTDLVCDQSKGEVGQLCLGDMQYACSADDQTGVQCIAGTFQRVVVCRGPKGCKLENKRIACDTSIVNQGDPCAHEDDVACSADKTQLLRCKTKAFEKYRMCRGAKGCTPDDPTPACDISVAQVDDLCVQQGRVACSPDKTTELVCQGSRFTLSRKCEKGCTPGVGGTSPICK